VTWIKLDDAFDQHPKLVEVGPLAAWLYVRGLCYANRNLTDGRISRAVARELAGRGPKGQRLVVALLAARLWETTTEGYAIHDFLEYQPSRADVMKLRLTKADAGRLGGVRSGQARRSKFEAQPEAAPKHAASSAHEAEANPRTPYPVPEPDRATSSLREESRRGGGLRPISDILAAVAR
jgi:hypothetical protein